METQKEEFVQDILNDPTITKQTGVSTAIITFFYMLVGLFIFFSILSVVSGQFEKIVICILFLIIGTLSGESTLSDLKEHGKNVRPLTGMFLMWWSAIPKIVALITLLYYIFIYR
ncbi:MAG: hypothetical protein M1459_00415 [Patescibacteria group bacterium]|nr:hypothetical protein [Patescibacteria group bacterium]